MRILGISTVTPRGYRDTLAHRFGEAAVYLTRAAGEKQAGDAVSVRALAGRLYLSKTGWLLLSVPNSLIRGAFDALNEPGVELPYHTDGTLEGHISVCRDTEVLEAGGSDVFRKDRGRIFHYAINGVKTVEPAGWDGVSRVWFLSVSSPELSAMRRSYGLPPLPMRGSMELPFHITIAVRKTSVLRHNDVRKAASA